MPELLKPRSPEDIDFEGILNLYNVTNPQESTECIHACIYALKKLGFSNKDAAGCFHRDTSVANYAKNKIEGFIKSYPNSKYSDLKIIIENLKTKYKK